jgi:hypothetical protein
MSSLTGYKVGGASSQISSGPSGEESEEGTKDFWSLQRCRRAYLDYLGTKREEIDEQQDARRLEHGSQWTSEQIRQLNLRRQPVTTNNQISRKINGVVGTLERLRQDPKAYARTPKHEQGAELATGALRYALDSQNWPAKDAQCSKMCAVDGIGGVEFNLTEGDHGDREVEIEVVFVDSFFYDPRSYRPDFSDSRFMGVGKWMDLDAAIDLYPEYEEELKNAVESGDDLSSEPDREFKWFQSYGNVRRVRIVDIWYRLRGEWVYCVFTGNTKLMEGKSYLVDEKGKTSPKYEMFSCFIDQDGDRYGLVRNLKPLQQQINMRESKALYTMLARRLIAEKGAFDDIEVARREGARPDGVVIKNKGFDAEFDDAARMAETEAQFKFLELVKRDFDSYGPNISLLGQGLENASGRAIHLLQQAGLADLGPFIQAYKDWKVRVYRKMWSAIQKHWSGERWIRVTDDDDISQWVQVNGVGVDPMTGLPTMVNFLGALDVDILLDEGPDEVNQMADAYDALTALVQGGTQIPPQVLIELAPIPLSVKKKVQEIMNPSSPEAQQKQQHLEMLQTKQLEADVTDKMAAAKLKEAQAIKAMADANAPPDMQMPDPGEDERKIQAEVAEKVAKVEKTHWETEEIKQRMQLEPQRMAMEQQTKSEDRAFKERESNKKMAIQLDGSVADQVNASAKQQGDQLTALGSALVKASQQTAESLEKASDTLAKAGDAMAQSAQVMAKAVTAKKRIVRDANGRAVGAESIE